MEGSNKHWILWFCLKMKLQISVSHWMWPTWLSPQNHRTNNFKWGSNWGPAPSCASFSLLSVLHILCNHSVLRHWYLAFTQNYKLPYCDYYPSTPALFKQWILEDIATFYKQLTHRQLKQQSSSEKPIGKEMYFTRLNSKDTASSYNLAWVISM